MHTNTINKPEATHTASVAATNAMLVTDFFIPLCSRPLCRKESDSYVAVIELYMNTRYYQQTSLAKMRLSASLETATYH